MSTATETFCLCVTAFSNALLTRSPPTSYLQMNFKSGQAHGFALFDSGAAAQAANSLVAQIQFDETSILRCELARKNMFVKVGLQLERVPDIGHVLVACPS